MKHLLPIALTVLLLACCTTPGEYRAMSHGLDSINGLNRSDRPFSPADVQPYVSYFDRHGSGNDRLLAHYLLGRAYHEQGEAPMALQCYQEALAAADTTAADCDYAQLSRVYGQTCELFYYQGFYQEELQYRDFAIRCAWLGKDTLAAILNYEQKAHTYRYLHEEDSVVAVCEKSAALYTLYGYPDYAASVLGTCLRTLIEQGDYQKAKKYIDIYEAESGFFDSNHNIEHGREIYYNVKAYYYLGVGKLDSAKYFFWKELQFGKDLNNQNAGAKGLAETFKRLHKPDSVAKYALYGYNLIDSLYRQRSTEEIVKIQSAYKYSRLQEVARIESEKAARRSTTIWACVTFIILLLLLIYIITVTLIHKQQDTERRYLESLEIIQQAKEDIKKLSIYEEINKNLIEEKESVITRQVDLQQSMLEEEPHIQHYADKSLRMTEIFHRFETMAITGNQPLAADWIQLEDAFGVFYPGFVRFLNKHRHMINDKEYKTCLLLRLSLKPTTISNMLDVRPSYISNIRVEMLEKLFSLKGKAKEFDSLIQKTY